MDPILYPPWLCSRVSDRNGLTPSELMSPGILYSCKEPDPEADDEDECCNEVLGDAAPPSSLSYPSLPPFSVA